MIRIKSYNNGVRIGRRSLQNNYNTLRAILITTFNKLLQFIALIIDLICILVLPIVVACWLLLLFEYGCICYFNWHDIEWINAHRIFIDLFKNHSVWDKCGYSYDNSSKSMEIIVDELVHDLDLRLLNERLVEMGYNSYKFTRHFDTIIIVIEDISFEMAVEISNDYWFYNFSCYYNPVMQVLQIQLFYDYSKFLMLRIDTIKEYFDKERISNYRTIQRLDESLLCESDSCPIPPLIKRIDSVLTDRVAIIYKVKTRFGTKSSLNDLIALLKSNNINWTSIGIYWHSKNSSIIVFCRDNSSSLLVSKWMKLNNGYKIKGNEGISIKNYESILI